MSIFESIRAALITLLRADRVEFEPPPKSLARGLAAGRLDRFEIRATDVPIEHTDVSIAQLDIRAEDMRIKLSLRGPALRVGAATFDATLTQEQLSILVPLPRGVDRLSVTERGFTFHTVAGIPIYTSVSLADGQLVVAPSAPAKVPILDMIGIDIGLPQLPGASGLEQLTRFGLSFALPELPAGAEVEQLELGNGYVQITGTADLNFGR